MDWTCPQEEKRQTAKTCNEKDTAGSVEIKGGIWKKTFEKELEVMHRTRLTWKKHKIKLSYLLSLHSMFLAATWTDDDIHDPHNNSK
uniref:Uncharacterized protein n=1 Tax=Arion vulgaris TaxID=1028688 RepID=A0A0B7BDC4_9EUPU